jgi:hypothetical protein
VKNPYRDSLSTRCRRKSVETAFMRTIRRDLYILDRRPWICAPQSLLLLRLFSLFMWVNVK